MTRSLLFDIFGKNMLHRKGTDPVINKKNDLKCIPSKGSLLQSQVFVRASFLKILFGHRMMQMRIDIYNQADLLLPKKQHHHANHQA